MGFLCSPLFQQDGSVFGKGALPGLTVQLVFHEQGFLGLAVRISELLIVASGQGNRIRAIESGHPLAKLIGDIDMFLIGSVNRLDDSGCGRHDRFLNPGGCFKNMDTLSTPSVL